MKLPNKASCGPETCEVGPKVAIWGIRRTGFAPKIPPSFTEHLDLHHGFRFVYQIWHISGPQGYVSQNVDGILYHLM